MNNKASEDVKNVNPIIFIFSPSASGKSYLSDMLVKKMFLFIHIDTDSKKRSFKANGFPPEWDKDFSKVKLVQLVDELRNRLNKEYAGAIISFPTTNKFTHKKLVEATKLGVTPVILWGKKEYCLLAKEERLKQKGSKLNSAQLERYNTQNDSTFQTYGRSEYDAFKVEVFQEDGTRYSGERLLAQIMKRTGK